MKKIWLGIAAILVLAVIGGAFYVLTNLDSIVARIIEDEGGKVAGTDVSVSGVDISLREGSSTIAGLNIASPDGYGVDQAFSLDEITVVIDLGSLRDDPIVIEEVRVQAPEVRAEILANGSSNILDLQKNARQFADARNGGAGQKDADRKHIRIKRLVFEKGRIELDATALGLEARSVDLPAIQLDDIGGAEGARPDAIAQAVLGALTRQASAEIAKTGVQDKVRDLVKDQAKDKASDLLDKIGK